MHKYKLDFVLSVSESLVISVSKNFKISVRDVTVSVNLEIVLFLKLSCFQSIGKKVGK